MNLLLELVLVRKVPLLRGFHFLLLPPTMREYEKLNSEQNV